jgi:hypothetical protein
MTSKQSVRKGAPSSPTKTPAKQAKPAALKLAQPAVKTAVAKKSSPAVALAAGKNPIPSAPPTKGMAFKMPKMKGGTSAEMIQKRLKKKSPWFASISDPLHGADCKIPDETGVETGCLQIVQRGTVTVNGNGVAGARISTPYVNNCNATPGTGVNIQVLPPATASQTSIAWGDGTTSGVTYGFEWNGSAEIRTVTNAHRVVSCALYVQPEPALADNKGEICLFAEPFADLDSPNYTDYLNNYKSVVVPINSNQASKVLWYPFARQDWSFKSFLRTDGDGFNTDDSINDSDLPTPWWTLGFIAAGAAETVVIRYTAVVNFEFVPDFNTLNILGASPSPQDVTEVDLVENWVQDMPVAEPIPQRQAASSPDSVKPSHDDDQTGFGMFFNVVKELAPLALALL